MHIALLTPAWPLAKFQNGIITYVHWMQRGLEDLGHRVSVFTCQLDPGHSEPNVHVVAPRHPGRAERVMRRLTSIWRPHPDASFEFSAAIAGKMIEVHRRDPIDVIEMEESFGWCADVARQTALPVVVKLHGPAFLSMMPEEIETPFGREKIEREGAALRRSVGVTSPCRITLLQTVEKYALTPPVEAHVENPLIMDDGTPLWALDRCDRDTILFVGRFDMRKGADVVIDAFAVALRTHPRLKLIVVGPDRGVPDKDGRSLHFEEFCAARIAPGVRARIDFRGPMANRDIADLRTRAMLTVVASRWENPGYTLLEAMFQACPIVSSDAGGCPECVTDGESGLLARSGEPEDFAAKICTLIDDPRRAEAMGLAARRYVLERHAAEVVAAKSVDIYERVIAQRAT
jgi:glycosyltransferase involved in cell wall biosynthesis